MITFRKLSLKVRQFFQDHYLKICFVAIFTIVLIGFLHFELKKNNRDLIYWKNFLDYCYNELDHFGLLAIILVLLFKIMFLALVVMMNRRSVDWFDELSQLEVKKRYADFLFLRLISDIDKIESEYLRNSKTRDIITLKAFIMAHDDMTRTIENFRKDARKLLAPNEMEIALPIEDVYGIMETEEMAIRRSKFYDMDVDIDDAMIKKLVNA